MFNKLSKDDINKFKGLTLEQSLNVLDNIEETYHAVGEIFIEKYIEEKLINDPLYLDKVQSGVVKAWVAENPYRVAININELPPRLSAYSKTRFSQRLGFMLEKARWRMLVKTALKTIEIQPFTEKVVIHYLFRFSGNNDIDNHLIKFINDAIRDSRIIKDDTHNHVSLLLDGTPNADLPGFTITIFSRNNLQQYFNILDNN